MSTTNPGHQKVGHRHDSTVDASDTGKEWANTPESVRHTKEDAINERQFERMVRSTYHIILPNIIILPHPAPRPHSVKRLLKVTPKSLPSSMLVRRLPQLRDAKVRVQVR